MINKHLLIQAHRWVGLILAPLFLIILLSGAVLALKPILAGPEAAPAGPVDAQAVARVLAEADPEGRARQVDVGSDGRSLLLTGASDGILLTYDLGSGLQTGAAPEGFDLFETAESLHKDLLVGAGIVVEVATYAMLLLIIVGPILAWPRLRNTLLGWHLGLGWLVLPLWLLLPLTGVLMTLHVGMGELPRIPPSETPVAFTDAVRAVAAEADLAGLQQVRRFRGGTALVRAAAADGPQAWIVSAQGVTPLDLSGNWPREIHEGTWAGAWSGTLNLITALGLTALTVTGFLSWLRRHRQERVRSGDAGADLLVAYASQTGTAARLAAATAEALRRGGERVALASLGALNPAELPLYRQTLLLVSTTGEGELPDPGRSFLKSLATTPLAGVRFAMLALGDSRYRNFCGGGETLASALVTAGARLSLPLERADGEPRERWRGWLASLRNGLGLHLEAPAEVAGDVAIEVRLAERTRLDNPEDPETHESDALVLETDPETPFRPGDLLLVTPTPGAPERCYSIGSSAQVTPGRIRLSVALNQWRDETGALRTGAASGLLCRDLKVGETLSARLRAHEGFRPPEENTRPLILVAAGCGIAPFMGFLDERAADAQRGPTWLFFGNRKRTGDYLYGDRLETLQRNGVLTRLDTAFSRDQAERVYVTHRLVERGRELAQWLLEQDAALYVCGRGSTLGRGVDEALEQVLTGFAGKTPAEAAQLLETWKSSGKIRRDLFD